MAEETIIARDVLLAEHTGGRLHICHLSTAGSVEVIRWAKSRGISVTAEVTPHHLLLNEQLVADYNPLYKVNPPLRTERDVLALREALIDGTIDIIATDHAPHAAELKDCEWSAAAFGMVGLETAASIAQLVLIDSKQSNWQRMAEVLSYAPAQIAGDADQGQRIAVGNAANLTLIDANSKRTISASSASKSSNNPFQGLELPGTVVHTIFKGRFTVRNSTLVEQGAQ
jgi:dihydroorotase